MISLTPQELKIVNYLQQKKSIMLAELSQFAKPDVKLRTLQKTVSEIKRKYKDAGINFPECEVKVQKLKIFTKETIVEKEVKIEKKEEGGQKLIQVQRAAKSEPMVAVEKISQFQTDFKLNFNTRQVITKAGIFPLDNVDDWEIMKYFWNNAGKKISIEELKDVCWHNYGSKTPSRWMDAILRRINNLRRAIKPLVGRIVTVPDQKQGTFFLVM